MYKNYESLKEVSGRNGASRACLAPRIWEVRNDQLPPGRRKLKEQRSFAKLVFVALVVFCCVSVETAHGDAVLLEDDFGGTTLNTLNWTARGSSVAVANGGVLVSQASTDQGGFLTSRPLTFASTGLITIRERVYVHANTESFGTFVYGGTSLGNESWQFGAKHINITDPSHSWYPENINAFSFGDNDVATSLGVRAGGYGGGNNFGHVSAIWDAWFDEEMTLDPATSVVTYAVNGGQKVTGILTAPMPQGPLTLTFNSYGWWTGHYEMIDNVSVVQAVDPDLVTISLTWNTTTGGVDFQYQINNGPLSTATTAKLFWATGPTVNDIISKAPIINTQPIPAGADGLGGIINVSPDAFAKPPTGATYVLLVLDPDQLIPETDKTNNIKVIQIPDFAITSLSWNISGGIDFSYSVSGLQAPASSVQLFWSKGTNLADRISKTAIYIHDVPAGTIGASQPITIDPYDFRNPPEGATNLLLAIDADNLIPETNETNNISALELQIKMTAHRVTRQQADIASYNGIDDPIQPKTDLKILAQAPPLGLGVVADGVTPVLFKIIAPPGNYSLSVLSGQPYGELLTSRLFVLGSSGGWLKQTSIRIPQPPNGAKSGTNFAYLAGIDWADYRITLDEITVNVSLLSSVTGSHVSEIEFTNRPPPIVLVHGYNADASSWGPNFLAALESVRPKDFIVPISYGVSLETDPITGEITTNKTPNTTGRLDELAPILGEKLASTVENPNNDLRNEWAFTRYDIVCHSQGGVLTRMLCSQVPRYRTQPFVDEANMYRGRFRRIITIGSPHNGSLLLHYLLQLKRSSSLFYSSLPRILGDILQDKFDPFLDQMLDINNPFYSIDERAKFRLIRCVIDGGDSPGILSPPVFHLIGLSDQLVIADPLPVLTSRGALVIPRGSDGVVDFDSQGAGISGPGPIISEIDSDNVVHADAYPLLFGVLPRHSETTYRPVANEVVSLLNGPTNAFGKFKLPPPVPGSIRLAIDSIVPTLEPINIIKLIPGAKDLSYHFQVTPDPSRPAQGQVTWFAEAFTTNGVSTDGITLTTNTNNPTAVTVTVADSVVGDVVLYASYSSTNNILVVALPVVVVSRPAGMVMTGITLVPGSATMSIGDTLRPDIWATYTNGLRSQLYIPIGQASYTSSNTNVAVVDAAGTITLNSFGSATITASYNGFTATIPISSVTPEVRNLAGTMTTNGLFGLSYMGTYMMTNVIQASTNLSDWISLATLQNTNGFVQYTDTESPSLQQRFYRVLIK